jgi:hypothetical protein
VLKPIIPDFRATYLNHWTYCSLIKRIESDHLSLAYKRLGPSLLYLMIMSKYLTQMEIKYKEVLHLLTERIKKMDAVIESQKAFYDEKMVQNSDYAAQNIHLLQQISEKNRQITELVKYYVPTFSNR